MFVVVLAGLLLGSYYDGRASGPSGLLVPALGAGAMMLVPACAAAGLMLYCSVKSRNADPAGPESRWSLPWVYSKGAFFIQGLYFPAYWAALDVFGWASLPVRLHIDTWLLPSKIVIAAPFLASIFLAWIPLHYAELHVRRWGPTLRQRLSFNVRQYMLIVCAPMAALLTLSDLSELLSKRVGGPFKNDAVMAVLGMAVVTAVFVLMPTALVRLWKSSPLPDCPLRERLTALCRKIGVTFRDIRIWETPGLHYLNAAVMGVIGRVRYIVISRTLVETMSLEQTEAVFAHELGHAKRHHIAYYAVFVLNFLLLAGLFDQATGGVENWPGTSGLYFSAVALFLYGYVGFGYLSRAFEREADLFGAVTVGNAALFAGALEMIAYVNGMNPSARSWRHGSIRSRVEFLKNAAASPEVTRAFAERVAFLKIFLIVLGAVALAANAVIAAMQQN